MKLGNLLTVAFVLAILAVSALIFIIFFSLLMVLLFVLNNIVKILINPPIKEFWSSFSAISSWNSSKIGWKISLILFPMPFLESCASLLSVFWSSCVNSSMILLIISALAPSTYCSCFSFFILLFFHRLFLVLSWTFLFSILNCLHLKTDFLFFFYCLILGNKHLYD